LGYIYNLLGVIKKSKENYHQAVVYASKNSSYDELRARSYFNLAVHEKHLGNINKSKELVDKALEIMPEYPQAMQHLRGWDFTENKEFDDQKPRDIIIKERQENFKKR
jgi:tetratricopeptide (TPR) repeat protein